jgi:hydroxylamine reductase
MKCRQCEERIKVSGCAGNRGVCGKTAEVAELQDLLIYSLEGVATAALKGKENGKDIGRHVAHITEGLFSTLTNVNFDEKYFIDMIDTSGELIDEFRGLLETSKYGVDCADHDYS